MNFLTSEELECRNRTKRTVVFLGDTTWESIFNPLFEKIFSHLGMRADIRGIGSGLVDVYLPIGENPFESFVRYFSTRWSRYSRVIVLLPERSELEEAYDIDVFSKTNILLKIFIVFSDGSFHEMDTSCLEKK